jgi:hypothetical protein
VKLQIIGEHFFSEEIRQDKRRPEHKEQGAHPKQRS